MPMSAARKMNPTALTQNMRMSSSGQPAIMGIPTYSADTMPIAQR